MKREKNFFFIAVTICFILCYTIALILACRTVSIFNLTVTGSILVYPMTYFIAILYSERYGEENTKMLYIYSVMAIIFMVLLFTISSILPYNAPDGLEIIFNIDYRLVFASIASFFVGQSLCLFLYNYLSGFRGFRFLIATVISITVDSIIFISLSFFGSLPFIQISKLFIGQYVFNILVIIIYAIIFTYVIDSVVIKPNLDVAKEKPKKKKKSNKKEQ